LSLISAKSQIGLIASLVEVLAGRRDIDFIGAGSATFKCEDLATDFEPDSCFYIEHAALMRGQDEVDLAITTPPDLATEIDIPCRWLPHFPVFAAVGIPKIWRYDGKMGGPFTGLKKQQFLPRNHRARGAARRHGRNAVALYQSQFNRKA
jgi:Uma2 family endonuclease